MSSLYRNLLLLVVASSPNWTSASAGAPELSANTLTVELGKDMEPLRQLIGHWRLIAWTQSESGDWVSLTPSEAAYRPELRGYFIVGAGEQNVAAGDLEFTETFSFDPFQKIYRMTWNDSVVGLMDVYEGTIQGEKLVLSNLKSKTFWTTPDGISYAFRLELDLSVANDRRTVQVFSSSDGGKVWSLYQTTEYERISPPVEAVRQ